MCKKVSLLARLDSLLWIKGAAFFRPSCTLFKLSGEGIPRGNTRIDCWFSIDYRLVQQDWAGKCNKFPVSRGRRRAEFTLSLNTPPARLRRLSLIKHMQCAIARRTNWGCKNIPGVQSSFAAIDVNGGFGLERHWVGENKREWKVTRRLYCAVRRTRGASIPLPFLALDSFTFLHQKYWSIRDYSKIII